MSPSFRRLAALASGAGFAMLAVVLLFADRATFLLGPARRLTIRAGQAVETRLDIDFVDRSDIPYSFEHLGHAALWGTGMLVFGWVLRDRLPLVVTALFVAGTSMIFEAAQPAVSATRRFELADAVANGMGVAVALACLAVVVPIERRLAVRHVSSPAYRAEQHGR